MWNGVREPCPGGGGGVLPYLGMVGRFRWPSFLRFSIRLGVLFRILKPLDLIDQARSDWPLIVLIFNPIDPLFPISNPIDPLFLNPVISDSVWASLPKILLSPPLRVYNLTSIQKKQILCDLVEKLSTYWYNNWHSWIMWQNNFLSFHCITFLALPFLFSICFFLCWVAGRG